MVRDKGENKKYNENEKAIKGKIKAANRRS
jgi:hypothetical protein